MTIEFAFVSALAAVVIAANHGIVSSNGDGTAFVGIPATRIRSIDGHRVFLTDGMLDVYADATDGFVSHVPLTRS